MGQKGAEGCFGSGLLVLQMKTKPGEMSKAKQREATRSEQDRKPSPPTSSPALHYISYDYFSSVRKNYEQLEMRQERAEADRVGFALSALSAMEFGAEKC